MEDMTHLPAIWIFVCLYLYFCYSSWPEFEFNSPTSQSPPGRLVKGHMHVFVESGLGLFELHCLFFQLVLFAVCPQYTCGVL